MDTFYIVGFARLFITIFGLLLSPPMYITKEGTKVNTFFTFLAGITLLVGAVLVLASPIFLLF